MYKAKVVKIKTREHPNADRLQLGMALGNQVIVGLDTVDGEVGVFFGPDGQLSEEFAKANDLIKYKDPVTHEIKGGYFSDNRRVKAQNFRGEKSDGFWCPLSYFEFTGYDLSKLEVGDEFDELNGVPICNKYITPATMRARRGQKMHRGETKYFPQHVDTGQFRFGADLIHPLSLVTITEKVHGTSQRVGYVRDYVPLPRWKSMINRLLRRQRFERDTEFTYLVGTRRVIVTDEGYSGFFGAEEFRSDAFKQFQDQLLKGEIAFFEIVGYTETGGAIATPQDTSKLKDVKKQYGPIMEYKYGCSSGDHRVFVYRMAMVNDDGKLVEYPWYDVKRRCRELGVDHVPELAMPFFLTSDIDLRDLVESLVTGPSTIDPSHMREGVVIRVDSERGTYWLKHKSYEFGVLEGYLKEKEEYVDMEEAS